MRGLLRVSMGLSLEEGSKRRRFALRALVRPSCGERRASLHERESQPTARLRGHALVEASMGAAGWSAGLCCGSVCPVGSGSAADRAV